MASSSAPQKQSPDPPFSSYSGVPQTKYDVFLSFRGADTRYNFTSHLHKALRDKRIETYIDEKLNRGDEISPSLLKAIEDSQISVIIFSKEYASSIWCLEELVKILECKHRNGQMVIPVFYNVVPSDVRKQTGTYGEAFAKLEERFKESLDRIKRWRAALSEAANLYGFDSHVVKHESVLIENIVQDVLNKLVKLYPSDTNNLVGIDSKIMENPVDERPSEPTVGLDSKFVQVWSYISDKRVKIIGLYGKGGVGKTTLLTQINNEFLRFPNDFVVIWVVVSKDRRLENIQETIMKKIGLLNDEWKCKPIAEKAMDIFKILSRRKFVLLLDDIWERVNLIDIGIPPPSQEIDFKVVFTTRSIEVCSLMETHKKVEVECLSHAEAWKLFQNKVGQETLDSHPDIPAVAEDVARQCGGLPLAVITIGRAMAGKNQPEEWRDAISILRMSAHQFPGMEDQVLCLLKFSYDRLPGDVYRSCFLYCSLFPEDDSINKSELIDCWISEGFLKKNDGILARNARDFGHTIIGFLLRACLLEEGNFLETVRMHDVIRDMALWIACEVEEEKFLVCSGMGLTRAPEIREWENVKRVSLMENKIENLSETPNCPELLTLFLQGNRLKMLTSGFFGQMIHLKVLNLSRNHNLTELPVGISELVELQHLDLSATGIVELPEELKALTNLKCLKLEYTRSLRKIPRHVISNLSMLQVLRMYGCGSSIQSKDSILFDEGELFMEELVCLEHLNVLSIDFKNSHTLGRCLSCPVLQNCAVESVSIQLNDGSTSLNVLSLGVLKDLGKLHIRSTDLAELVIDREMRNVPQFYSLHIVYLIGCSKLRDATWLVFAPTLKVLWILGCDEMKEIISVEGEVGEMMGNQLPFPRLQFLDLRLLPKLESIYCNPLPFPHLKEILIIKCPKLKKLPLGSNSIMTWLVFAPNLKILVINGCDEMKEIISVEGEVGQMMGNQLPFQRLQRLHLQYLPKLESIYCNPLPFPHLKRIQIIKCPKLKKLPLGSNSIMTSRSLTIEGEEDWWNELQWEDQTTHDHFLPFFKAFRIDWDRK